MVQDGIMAGPQDRVRVYLRISGKVQGVFFRASTVSRAHELALTGWVRNCDDGSVELIAEGNRAAADRLIEWCRRGPPGAQVQNVQLDWQPCQNEFRQFSVRR